VVLRTAGDQHSHGLHHLTAHLHALLQSVWHRKPGRILEGYYALIFRNMAPRRLGHLSAADAGCQSASSRSWWPPTSQGTSCRTDTGGTCPSRPRWPCRSSGRQLCRRHVHGEPSRIRLTQDEQRGGGAAACWCPSSLTETDVDLSLAKVKPPICMKFSPGSWCDGRGEE
jgi:hypothetical protein